MLMLLNVEVGPEPAVRTEVLRFHPVVNIGAHHQTIRFVIVTGTERTGSRRRTVWPMPSAEGAAHGGNADTYQMKVRLPGRLKPTITYKTPCLRRLTEIQQ